MTVRSRQRDMRSQIQGTYRHLGWADRVNVADIGIREWCDDIIDERANDNPLAIKRWECITPHLDGINYDSDGNVFEQFEHYPIDQQLDPSDSRFPFGSFNEADRFFLARELLAKTNPSVAHIVMPAFYGELRDLPSLVHSWGNTLLKRVATGYVVWRWVVKPMLKDINRMCQFIEAVNQRLKWIDILERGKALRRNLVLRRNSTTFTDDRFLQSYGALVISRRTVVYTEKVWGSVRWRMFSPPKEKFEQLAGDNVAARVQQAKDLVVGINTFGALSTVWELMPWSWFVDWFGGLGDYINQVNNTIPCDVESICLMRKTESRSTYAPPHVCPTWVHINGTHFEQETYKGRYPVAPILLQVAPPVFSIPLLTWRNWSILGALAVLRARNKVPTPKQIHEFKWIHLTR